MRAFWASSTKQREGEVAPEKLIGKQGRQTAGVLDRFDAHGRRTVNPIVQPTDFFRCVEESLDMRASFDPAY
ncbi:MAG: hypothetical protein NVS9B4_28130 [Candidatus Acidiferrum sp.]